MKHIRALGISLSMAMLFSCTGKEAVPPLSITDRAALELENYSDSVSTSTLEWLPVSLDDDHGAVALVARESVNQANSGLPALLYEIDFHETGQFDLSLHGRRHSQYLSDHPVHLIFGADDGDIVLSVSGLDDQWSWYNTEDSGQRMSITVATRGVHQLQVSSGAEGLILDQLDIRRVDDEAVVTSDVHHTDSASENVPDADSTEDSDDQQLTDDPKQAPENQAPVALVIADSTVAAGSALGLNATASDDGMPYGNIYYYWTKTAGPGNASFSARQASVSSVTFDQSGIYTVQITVSDGQLFSNSLHNIVVTEADSLSPEQELSDEQPNDDNDVLVNSDDSVESVPTNLRWHSLTTRGKVTARHETGGVVVNGKLYVIGGRGERPVEVYDPQDNTWQHISSAPVEMHHFQPVAIGTRIYIAGAFTCCYPREDIIEHIYIFDTVTHRWSKGPNLPASRRRGSAGAVAYNGKIYLIGGNTRGHSGGAVNWFDEFDPATGDWTVLRAAPDARDHVTVAVVNSKLVVAGGRKTNTPVPFANTVSRTNVYDFKTGRWSSEANIPTERAGTMTVAIGDEVIVIGGESTAGANAHRDVEAYNVTTRRWRTLDDLRTARHGGAAGVLNGAIHVVAGNTTRGGGRETSTHEVLR